MTLAELLSILENISIEQAPNDTPIVMRLIDSNTAIKSVHVLQTIMDGVSKTEIVLAGNHAKF